MRRFFQWLSQKIRGGFSNGNLLCDSCKYNWREACTRKERPNVKKCPDYKPRR